MKNELRTAFQSSGITLPETTPQTTFSISNRINRSVLEPYLDQEVMLMGELGRFGESPHGRTILIRNGYFAHGDLNITVMQMQREPFHHAWMVLGNSEESDKYLKYSVGESVGGRAKVIMYTKKNGDLSYGFQLLPQTSYWMLLQKHLCQLVIDMDQHSLLHQNPTPFIIKTFIRFNAEVKSHKDSIAHHGMGFNSCKRVSDRVERDLLKLARVAPITEVATGVLEAVNQCDTYVSDLMKQFK